MLYSLLFPPNLANYTPCEVGFYPFFPVTLSESAICTHVVRFVTLITALSPPLWSRHVLVRATAFASWKLPLTLTPLCTTTGVVIYSRRPLVLGSSCRQRRNIGHYLSSTPFVLDEGFLPPFSVTPVFSYHLFLPGHVRLHCVPDRLQ